MALLEGERRAKTFGFLTPPLVEELPDALCRESTALGRPTLSRLLSRRLLSLLQDARLTQFAQPLQGRPRGSSCGTRSAFTFQVCGPF